MRLSLNEIEVTVRKAALGAGLPLGLAEDAGRAAAWLAARGFPMAELIFAALAAAPAELRLEREGTRCRILAEDGPCPVLQAGPSACDFVVAGARSGAPASVAVVLDVPMVAVAQAALASAESGLALAVETAGAPAAVLVGGEAALSAGPAGLAALRSKPIVLGIAERPMVPVGALRTNPEPASREGVSVPPALWGRIQALADRTLVPATAHSHERGAGAGLIDSD
jgi:hypothetical protein